MNRRSNLPPTENRIVENIRNVMLRNGVEPVDLARKSGVALSDLEATLAGKRVLSSAALVAIGRVLGMTVHDLVADDSDDED